ncbi:MAG: hypothetical protein U0457_18095 [Candidatus Sericytochromatia bacterium]
MYIKEDKKLLSITESASELGFSEEQIFNAIKLGILTTLKIKDKNYIYYDSLLLVKNDLNLQEQILDEDELSFNEIIKILDIKRNDIKKLVEDGYIVPFHKMKGKSLLNVVKRKQIKFIASQISELKEFWINKSKINKKIGIKKTNNIRLEKLKKENVIIKDLLDNLEKESHYNAILIKTCLSLVSLNFFIQRKLRKNIIDKELLELYKNSFIKLFSFYRDNEFIRFYLLDIGQVNIEYCQNCISKIKKEHIYTSCENCYIDHSYYYVLNISINFLNHRFSLNINYKDIRDVHTIKNIPFKVIKVDDIEDNFAMLNSNYINSDIFNSFKLFEIIDNLKLFANYYELNINKGLH